MFFVSVSAHLSLFDSSVVDGMQQDFSDKYNHRSHRDIVSLVTYQSPQIFWPGWTSKLVTIGDLASLLSQPLAAIFNASLHEGYLPLIWKSVEVVPVPKIHPPKSIHSDLRPLSLQPTIAKVFESSVGKWFLSFIEPHLDCCQFGCRKSRSTTHALIAIHIHNHNKQHQSYVLK